MSKSKNNPLQEYISNLIIALVVGAIGLILVIAGTHFWHPLSIIGAIFIIFALFIAWLFQ